MIEQKIDELIASIDRLTQAVTNHTTAADFREATSKEILEAAQELPLTGKEEVTQAPPAAEVPKKGKGKKAAAEPITMRISVPNVFPAQVTPPETVTPDPVAEVTAPAEPEITIKDLRDAAQRLVDKDAGMSIKIKATAQLFGAEAISQVPSEKYSEVLQALKDLLPLAEVCQIARRIIENDPNNTEKVKAVSARFGIPKISAARLEQLPEIKKVLTELLANLEAGV